MDHPNLKNEFYTVKFIGVNSFLGRGAAIYVDDWQAHKD